MLTTIQDKKINDSKLRMFNKVFRICMHAITLGLFLSTFWMRDCHDTIYPANFIAVVALIFIHQIYDLFLYFNDYMIDWENLPFKSKNQLRFNKQLF
jgi:tellurite resistance protein TehA-like permease